MSIPKVDVAPTVDSAQPGARRGAPETRATRPAHIESFRSWAIVAMSAPNMRKDMRARVAHHKPEDLPELIEVLCETELACLTRFGEFNQRMRDRRRRARLLGVEQSMSLEEYTERTERWYEGVRWLQDLRLYLGQRIEAQTDTFAAPRAA